MNGGLVPPKLLNNLLHFRPYPSLSELSSTSVPSLVCLQCVINTGPLHVSLKSWFMSLLSGVNVTLPRTLFKLRDRGDGSVAGVHKL